MANLRNGFAQSPFQFSLAGVVYVDNSDWFACNNLGAYKVQNRRGGLDAMVSAVIGFLRGCQLPLSFRRQNVYVCDYAAKGFGGTANLPPLAIGSTAYNDGVTIMNPALGLPDFAHQVLIHQAGHWYVYRRLACALWHLPSHNSIPGWVSSTRLKVAAAVALVTLWPVSAAITLLVMAWKTLPPKPSQPGISRPARIAGKRIK